MNESIFWFQWLLSWLLWGHLSRVYKNSRNTEKDKDLVPHIRITLKNLDPKGNLKALPHGLIMWIHTNICSSVYAHKKCMHLTPLFQSYCNAFCAQLAVKGVEGDCQANIQTLNSTRNRLNFEIRLKLCKC